MKFHLPDSVDDQPAGLQMAPMVDVVFQLLAFFVLASQFRLPERDFAMGYAEATAVGKGAVAADFPSHIPVRLSKSAGGVSIMIGQAHLADNDFAAIRAKLTQINLPDVSVRILAHGDLSVDCVAQALDAVLASPMKKVSISKLVVARAGAPAEVARR